MSDTKRLIEQYRASATEGVRTLALALEQAEIDRDHHKARAERYHDEKESARDDRDKMRAERDAAWARVKELEAKARGLEKLYSPEVAAGLRAKLMTAEVGVIALQGRVADLEAVVQAEFDAINLMVVRGGTTAQGVRKGLETSQVLDGVEKQVRAVLGDKFNRRGA